MNKNKIINDPVLGFIQIPNAAVYDIFVHPFVQRLSRIRQLGLSFLVYPGATHTRFLHSLGAMHLMEEALAVLKSKGCAISQEEQTASLIAILLHDIGHGPFSHVLEHSLVKGIDHETISLMMMQQIAAEMQKSGQETNAKAMKLAIDIFTDNHKRHFFHQLVSSQLDMDRLDYLRRDAFFCGVQEGLVGSERLIKMLNVTNDRIVIDAKGIYSVEKYLLSRRFMYLQVYLHKTSVAAEQMLLKILARAKELIEQGVQLPCSPALLFFFLNKPSAKDFYENSLALQQYAMLDDNDIMSAINSWTSADDLILKTLSTAFITRHLFKGKPADTLNNQTIDELTDKYSTYFGIPTEHAHYFFENLIVTAGTYSSHSTPIFLLHPDGKLLDVSSESDIFNIRTLTHKTNLHYLFYFPIQ